MTNNKTQIKESELDIAPFSEFFFGFSLYNYQKDFLNNCMKFNRVVGIFSRQSGKSQSVAIYSLFKALLNDDLQIIIVAPTQSQSSELYNKIRDMAEGNVIIKTRIVKSTETEMKFINGSRIISLPSGPEGRTIRGYTADIVVIEEAGIMKDSIVNMVILPMIASKKDKGQIIKIGTPLIKNHFYNSCFSDSKYRVTKVTWKECVAEGHYSQEFIDDMKRNILDIEFRTEFESEFIEDLNSFFASELVNKCLGDFDLWIK